MVHFKLECKKLSHISSCRTILATLYDINEMNPSSLCSRNKHLIPHSSRYLHRLHLQWQRYQPAKGIFKYECFHKIICFRFGCYSSCFDLNIAKGTTDPGVDCFNQITKLKNQITSPWATQPLSLFKNRSKFSHLLTVRTEGADPFRLTVSLTLTVKRPFFMTPFG